LAVLLCELQLLNFEA